MIERAMADLADATVGVSEVLNTSRRPDAELAAVERLLREALYKLDSYRKRRGERERTA